MNHDFAKPIYPNQRWDYKKHQEFISECWTQQARLDQAQEDSRNGNPWAMLRIDPEVRPWGKLQFQIYLQKNQKI